MTTAFFMGAGTENNKTDTSKMDNMPVRGIK